MTDPQPTLYVIAGCNGAGKTTFAREFLPREVKCLRFYNADEIARGLSPLDPPAAALKAGRLLLAEVHQSLQRRESFALETTLSGRTYVKLFRDAKHAGYRIEIHYLWLPSVTQALARVRQRVKLGGHNIPPADIRRRYKRSLAHLVTDYLPLADGWTVWDNRARPPKLVATFDSHSTSEVDSLLHP
jgi:predicted ABC-type ATPase